MPVIYKVTNIKTNKEYIGYTKFTGEYRFTQHISESNYQRKSILHDSIRKYGKENFVLEILEESSDPIYLHQIRENYWIQKYNTLAPNGYNIQPGGEGNVNPKNKTPVCLFDSDLQLIKEFESMSACARFLQVPGPRIHTACNYARQGKSSSILKKKYYLAYKDEIPHKRDLTYYIEKNKKLIEFNTGKKRPNHSLFMKNFMEVNRDSTVYNWIHKNGNTFIGTRYELTQYDLKSNIKVSELGEILSGRYKSHRGWRIR